MTKPQYKGHEIETNINGNFVYSDNKQLVSDEIWRSCGHCGLETTKEKHDGCLGELPDVMNACCGHGLTSAAYVQLPSARIVNGRLAKKLIKKLKGSR